MLAKIDIRIERYDEMKMSIASSFESGSSVIEIRKKKNSNTQGSSLLTFGGLAKKQEQGLGHAKELKDGASPALAALQAELKTPKESQSVKSKGDNRI